MVGITHLLKAKEEKSNRKSPSRRHWIILSLSVIVAAPLLFLYLTGPPDYWHELFFTEWTKSFEARGQKKICEALNKYYSEHGEYPACLLGGVGKQLKATDLNAGYVSSPYWGKDAEKMIAQLQHVAESLSDPLLEGGYLDYYPIWPYGWRYRSNLNIADPRGLRRIRNIVSSPNDRIVEYYEALAAPRIGAIIGSGEVKEYHDHDPVKYYVENGLFEKALKQPRVYCGGVYEKVWADSYSVSNGYSSADIKAGEGKESCAFSAPFAYALLLIGQGEAPVRDQFSLSGQFGYQRGDTIESLDGGTPREAWLWFYGEIIGSDLPEEQIGLDLVDNAKGLIKPDGIPDGIVFLYKFKDGKVIKVVKQYD